MPRIFLVWLVLASCIGWATYQLKYEVQRLEDRLTRVNRQILADQESIQVLKAEWSYLNQPAHLAEMAQKFLNLEPMLSKQMVPVAALPARKEPPATVVARAPGVPVPVVTAAAPPPPPAPAAPAKPAAPAMAPDFDEEATSVPGELTEDPPAAAPDASLLLVKGVPQ